MIKGVLPKAKLLSVSKKPLPLPLGEVARFSGSERVLDFS